MSGFVVACICIVVLSVVGLATFIIHDQRATIKNLRFALMDLRRQVLQGNAFIAPFDHDGDGKPGGSRRKA